MIIKIFKNNQKEVQKDLKNILMLIEANDEGLLKKYFENQIEKETKELIKSDPNFAWVSELGVKERTS